MPKLQMNAMRNELLRSGIAPREVRRTIAELNDHYDDLYDHAIAAGSDAQTAQQLARRELGDLNAVVAAMQSRPELRSWAYRYPRLALVVYPLTCLVALPAIPVMMGITHSEQLGRWTASLLLSGLVTAAMFLALQLTISPI